MNGPWRFFLSGREALVLALAVALIMLVATGVFFAVESRIELILGERQAAVVDSELRFVQVVDAEEGRAALVRFLARRANVQSDDLPIHALLDAQGKYLAGDVDWPEGIVPDGRWQPIETNKRDNGDEVSGFGRAVILPDGAKVLIGRDRSAQRGVQSALAQAIITALSVLLLVTAALIVLMNRRVLGRIDAIAGTARRIIGGNLHERIPLRGGDTEFDRLGVVLNSMLDRNEAHIDQMRIVTEAIAHDLRLPLQRVKANLERAQILDDANARNKAFDEADEEIDRALATFNALLEITRAESGIGAEGFEDVELADVVRDVVELFEPVAEDKGQTLLADVEPAIVRGQGTLLRQALGNLVQNAIKFAPEGASITVRLRQTAALTLLSVQDTGLGIPESERATALRPFGRLARDEATDGKGLGLALVAACAKLHGGLVKLEDAGPGLRAIIELPRA